MTSHDLLAALRVRYGPPEYALFTEVGNATGGSASRTADALAMGLWPSRGLHLHGFEVKVGRGDWLRELKAPAKAEAVARYCDRWWVVAADKDIVKAGELPATWGLLVPKGSKLAVVVDAPVLVPEPVSKKFLAALLRRVSEQAPSTAALAAAHEAGVKEGSAAGHAAAMMKTKTLQDQVRDLRAVLAAFEAASGTSINVEWVAKAVGGQVREALAVRNASATLRRSAEHLADGLRRALEQADRALKAPPEEVAPALDRAEGTG